MWYQADLPKSRTDVCLSRQSGQHLLMVSFSAFDPKRTSIANGPRFNSCDEADARRQLENVSLKMVDVNPDRDG